MECEECGRVLLKNERTCPYCGRVYGPSNATTFLFAAAVFVGLFLLWMFWN